MTLRTTVGSNCGGCRRGGVIDRHCDVVDAVTVGTDGCARDSTRDGLAVHALGKLVRFSAMTLAAGVGNIDFRDRRLLVRRRLDIVTAVTISAHRSAHVAAGDGFCMHAFAIRKKRPIADAAAFHR